MTNRPLLPNFEAALWPFVEMLEHRKEVMPSDEWTEMVMRTAHFIGSNPRPYLGDDLPPADVLVPLVKKVFFDLIEKDPAESR